MTQPLADALTFLFRADFNTDMAAPLPSPFNVEVGSFTTVDTGNRLSISGGQLLALAGPSQPDPGIWSQAISRVIGRTLLAVTIPVSLAYNAVGFNQTPGAAGPATGIYFFNGTLSANVLSGQSLGAYSIGTVYQIASSLRSIGSLEIVKGGAYTNWTLVWVHTLQNQATLHATLHARAPGANFNLDTLRVIDRPAPFDTDYGLATQRLAGVRAQGDTFVHEANCIFEYTVTTLPPVANSFMNFRMQDASNGWRVEINAAGDMILKEIVAGVATTKTNITAVLANGHRIVVVADGTTIRIYSNNILRLTWPSAASSITATAGNLQSLNSAVISDIISWPRQLSGAAAALLDAALA